MLLQKERKNLKTVAVAAKAERAAEWTGGTYQERRNGSLSLLKTLMMRLSLVTASICGPGNWLLIRIPCNAMQTNPIHHSELLLRRAARKPTDRRDGDGERENHEHKW